MKSIKFVLLLVGLSLNQVFSQQCSNSVSIRREGAFSMNNYNSASPSCIQAIQTTNSNQAIYLVLDSVYSTCTSSDNIQIVASNVVIYDYCRRTNRNTPTFVKTNAVSLSIRFSGFYWFNFDVIFVDKTAVCLNTPPLATTTVASTTVTRTTVAPTQPAGSCGVPAITPLGTNTNTRIVGGVEATPNSWPWQVRIVGSLGSCGAVLIDNNWLLSAAHCAMPASSMTAYLGDHDKSVSSSTRVTRRISKFIGHPSYSDSGTDYDIALVKLATPVTFSNNISPVCAPASNINLAVGRTCWVTGWGDTKNTAVNGNVLRQATIPINNLKQCDPPGFSVLNDRQICAGIIGTNALNSKDACQGDSGGPLVVKEGNRFVLIGVVSSGFDACWGRGIYTSVPKFLDWINQTIKNN